MKLQSLMLRNSLFLLTLILALPAFWAAAQTKPDSASAQEKHSMRQQGFRPLPRNDAGLEAAQEGPEFLRHNSGGALLVRGEFGMCVQIFVDC